MKRVEATGKNVQQAIDTGLAMLDATLDQVDVEVVSDGGLFKKAKVVLTLTEDDDHKEDAHEVVSEPIAKREIQEVIQYGENSNETQEQVDETKREERKVALEKSMSYIKEYLEHLEYIMNITGDVVVEEKSRDIYVSMLGEYVSVFIGYHGECLSALQSMLNNLVYNKFGYKGRVFLDIAGYKDRRQEILVSLAKRMASSVQRSKKSCALEPMNSFERRVIHTALQDMNNISTHSEGVEPKRHLVIDYVE